MRTFEDILNEIAKKDGVTVEKGFAGNAVGD